MEDPHASNSPERVTTTNEDADLGWKELFPFAFFGITVVATLVTIILT